MIKEIKKEIQWGDHKLQISTGKLATQAESAVMVRMGDSQVLCTVCYGDPIEGQSFFPLTVNYREMTSSAGKIPGGYIKRETKPTTRETLCSRLIDRAVRPLFHEDFYNEVHIVCTVMSYDESAPVDILAFVGAAAALGISSMPIESNIAACRVGMIDGKFILNPHHGQMQDSDLDLVVAANKNSALMVESDANMISKEQTLDAIKFAHDSIKPVIALIEDMTKESGKEKIKVRPILDQKIVDEVKKISTKDIEKAVSLKDKKERKEKISAAKAHLMEKMEAKIEKGDVTIFALEKTFSHVHKDIARARIISKSTRSDGRSPKQIRDINCETGLLARTHGSALFCRGETQALATTTLGSSSDEQIVDGLSSEYRQNFMLDYIFPPYSVGEAGRMGPPGRREIGHGTLALRAIKRLIPSKDKFPYAIRVVSEITSCNGSSSMATICAALMSMMDAGVPISEMISGIAMGLIKDKKGEVILSDIIADEDALGDMDFKVAGSKDGITALQMDVKLKDGVSFDLIAKILDQAQDARIHIIDEMKKSISSHRESVSSHAPVMEVLQIDSGKIRDLIGPGGKVVKELCEKYSAKIDIEDDGKVNVYAPSSEIMKGLKSEIETITFSPEIGNKMSGTVAKIIESGAIINFAGGMEGFLHISEISHERIKSVESALNVDQKLELKVISIDGRGRMKLSLKNANSDILPEEPKKSAAATIKELPAQEAKKKRSTIKKEGMIKQEELENILNGREIVLKNY